jgi:hypothetical protein
MKVDPSEIKQTLELLEATPLRLASLTKGIDNSRLHLKPDESTWSANEILAHLRACADVWGKSILAMIVQDHPTLRYISPRTWIRKTDYPQQEFHSSLEAFTVQRSELLKSLRALKIEDRSRGATFTGTTRGREHTVLSYAGRIVQHESEHCAQIEDLLSEIRSAE